MQRRDRLDGPVRRCGGASAPAASDAPSAEASPSESAAAAPATPEPAAECAQSDADNAMQMWERSGGNKGMVDQLVCDWNTANPDKTDQPVVHPAHRDGRQDRPRDRDR